MAVEDLGKVVSSSGDKSGDERGVFPGKALVFLMSSSLSSEYLDTVERLLTFDRLDRADGGASLVPVCFLDDARLTEDEPDRFESR